MNTFEIKNLFSIKGKSGLWVLARLIDRVGMGHFQRLTADDRVTVKMNRCFRLENYVIYTEKKPLSVEDVFDNMLEREEEIPEVWDEISNEEQEKLMANFVPNYDKNKFKTYHMRKIVKWYWEVYEALEMLNEGTLDPYEEEQAKNKPTETEKAETEKAETEKAEIVEEPISSKEQKKKTKKSQSRKQ